MPQVRKIALFYIFANHPRIEWNVNNFLFIGEVPPHLHKLKSELERIYESLEKKNEMLMSAMMKNFGRT